MIVIDALVVLILASLPENRNDCSSPTPTLVLAAVMNNAFFGDGQAKGDLGEMPSVGRRDTVPCRHSGESEKCGQPAL
jgi:hypothetical protein